MDPRVLRQFYKSSYCKFFLRGPNFCKRGDKCSFAHCESELKRPPNLDKTKLCKDFMGGYCKQKNSEDCFFAHGLEDMRATEGLYKTEICYYFEKGLCLYGSQCRYAHGDEDIRGKHFGGSSSKKKGLGKRRNKVPLGNREERVAQLRSMPKPSPDYGAAGHQCGKPFPDTGYHPQFSSYEIEYSSSLPYAHHHHPLKENNWIHSQNQPPNDNLRGSHAQQSQSDVYPEHYAPTFEPFPRYDLPVAGPTYYNHLDCIDESLNLEYADDRDEKTEYDYNIPEEYYHHLYTHGNPRDCRSFTHDPQHHTYDSRCLRSLELPNIHHSIEKASNYVEDWESSIPEQPLNLDQRVHPSSCNPIYRPPFQEATHEYAAKSARSPSNSGGHFVDSDCIPSSGLDFNPDCTQAGMPSIPEGFERRHQYSRTYSDPCNSNSPAFSSFPSYFIPPSNPWTANSPKTNP